MRAFASQERLTFKRTPASLAVSRGERSWFCLFISIVSIEHWAPMPAFTYAWQSTSELSQAQQATPQRWPTSTVFWPTSVFLDTFAETQATFRRGRALSSPVADRCLNASTKATVGSASKY